MNITRYILRVENLDSERILNSWRWLVGKNKTIVAITKAGDLIYSDESGKLHFLDTGNGTIAFVSENSKDFTEGKLSEESFHTLLLPPLIEKLESSNISLLPLQVYSYKLLPIIGGAYDEKNMFPLNVYEHFAITGDIHFQLKDTPDGTLVEVVLE